MNTKQCVNCACENQEHFTYCKYCGALLPVVDKQPTYTQAASDTLLNDRGINRHEYKRYVGSNADSILSVFETMEIEKNKASFCSPVFFLGIFFGFYGISAWFLSRKLKNQGILFLLIGAVFTFIDSFLNIGLNNELYEQLMLIFSGNTTALQNSGYSITSYFYGLVSISVYASVICSFIAGFFALRIYKSKVTSDILKIKSQHTEDSTIPLDIKLKKAGGRRDTAAIIPFLGAVIFNILAFGVTVI